MRQDIVMDPQGGEMLTQDHLATKSFCDFAFIEAPLTEDTVQWRYAEARVPAGFEALLRSGAGLYVRIPYTAQYKGLKLRLAVYNAAGGVEYLINRGTNGVWFEIRRPVGRELQKVRLSELALIDDDGCFLLQPSGEALAVYSAAQTDLRLGAAKSQNEVFLLKAAPGTLYQHPTTGVGLIDFLHSNLENNALAERLQREFANDGMLVRNAYMDTATGELLLDIEEKDTSHG